MSDLSALACPNLSSSDCLPPMRPPPCLPACLPQVLGNAKGVVAVIISLLYFRNPVSLLHSWAVWL